MRQLLCVLGIMSTLLQTPCAVSMILLCRVRDPRVPCL